MLEGMEEKFGAMNIIILFSIRLVASKLLSFQPKDSTRSELRLFFQEYRIISTNDYLCGYKNVREY